MGKDIPISFIVDCEKVNDIVKLTAKIEACLFVDGKIVDRNIICEVEKVPSQNESGNCVEQMLLNIPKTTSPTVEGKLFSVSYSVSYCRKLLFSFLLIH